MTRATIDPKRTAVETARASLELAYDASFRGDLPTALFRAADAAACLAADAAPAMSVEQLRDVQDLLLLACAKISGRIRTLTEIRAMTDQTGAVAP